MDKGPFTDYIYKCLFKVAIFHSSAHLPEPEGKEVFAWICYMYSPILKHGKLEILETMELYRWENHRFLSVKFTMMHH